MQEKARTIFITGAASGIGKATAKYFSERGWNVAATVRTPDHDGEVHSFKNTRVYNLDVTVPETIGQAMTRAISDFGRIDVVVNNAGYGVEGIFEGMSEDVIRRQFETNVFGLMFVTQRFIEYFRTHEMQGCIVQVSSMGGRVAFPLYSLYHGTKWAIEGFSESLHYELAPFGIRMKIIEPGLIRTDFYSRNREVVSPAEVRAYDPFMDRCTAVSRDMTRWSVRPERIARVIFRAAEGKSHRLRYAAGYPAPLLLRLRKCLPERLFFALIRLSYGIR